MGTQTWGTTWSGNSVAHVQLLHLVRRCFPWELPSQETVLFHVPVLPGERGCEQARGAMEQEAIFSNIKHDTMRANWNFRFYLASSSSAFARMSSGRGFSSAPGGTTSKAEICTYTRVLGELLLDSGRTSWSLLKGAGTSSRYLLQWSQHLPQDLYSLGREAGTAWNVDEYTNLHLGLGRFWDRWKNGLGQGHKSLWQWLQ